MAREGWTNVIALITSDLFKHMESTMSNPVLANIDQQIKQLEADLEAWKNFRAMLASSPSMIEQIQRVIFDPKSNGSLNPARFSQPLMISANRIQQIQTFFRERKNEWAGVNEIRDGTGLTRSICKAIVHYRYAPLFERNRVAQNRVMYRLSPEGLALTDFENLWQLPPGPRPPGYEESHRKHYLKRKARQKAAKPPYPRPGTVTSVPAPPKKKLKPIPRYTQPLEEEDQ